MLRLVVLLSVGMFATLAIAGRDTGQLRPGLARAHAIGKPIVEITPHYTQPAEIASDGAVSYTQKPQGGISLTALTKKPTLSKDTDLPPPLVVERRPLPPMKDIPKPANTPIFTLEGFGNRLNSPQGDYGGEEYASYQGDSYRTDGAIDPSWPSQNHNVSYGSTWMVTANTVNIRQGPSSHTQVVGRLVSGEAVTVLGDPNQAWLAISINGDQIDGYVSRRFLTPY